MPSDKSNSAPGARLDPDMVEKVVVVVLLAFLTSRMVPAVVGSAGYINVLLLISETIVVFFVVFRRPAIALSYRSVDWALGFAGTFVALLAIPASGAPLVPIGVSAALMIAGFLLQLAAKLTLNRSFGVVAANRGVKIGGPYRLIRHPMYAGYMLTHAAFVLGGPNLWNIVVYSAAFCLFVARIIVEERVLQADPAYQALSQKVRYRLVPFVF